MMHMPDEYFAPSAHDQTPPDADPSRGDQRGHDDETPDPIEPMEPTPGAESRASRGADGHGGPSKPRSLPVAAQALLQSLENPWLLAAWPGMGGVAAIAAGHLAQTIGAQPVGMLSLAEHFPLDGVDVQHGIARSTPTPRCLLLAWKDPQRKRDLLVLLGEAQPPAGGADICRKIIDMAQARGVERIVTFAAMGSQLDPREEPRVFGATTAPELLDEFTDAEIERLPQGRVSGLNGALLAVAAERRVPAACLLGEMPIFAAGMPNPRASLEVLNAFNRLANLDVNVDLLIARAEEMQPQLEAMHDQISALGEGGDADDVRGDLGEDLDDKSIDRTPTPPQQPPAKRPPSATPRVDDNAREHIERLFQMAASDREEAPRLKTELDRLGVFAEYEDRFLDLFQRPS